MTSRNQETTTLRKVPHCAKPRCKMNRLEEMLKCQRPPGFGGNAKDPEAADQAIPRALKELEQTQSASKIAREAGWSVKTLRKTWGI